MGAAALIMGVAVLSLRAMGRPWWCSCEAWHPWAGDVWSSHNSQHLIDPYVFTHILHGVLLYAVLHFAFGERLSLAWRGVAAAALETLWELIENTSVVVERYRTATLSLDYFGDSVINSLGDIAACMSGFALAATLPVWASILFFLSVEVALLWWIKDSLLLNVFQFFVSNQALKDWQIRPR